LFERILRKEFDENFDGDGRPSLKKMVKTLQNDSSIHLPSELRENLDVVRTAGNFAAHQQRDSEGTLVDLDESEARFALNLIDQLIDHLYVRPTRYKEARKEFESNTVEGTYHEVHTPQGDDDPSEASSDGEEE
jgi:hypothetical protein